MIQQFYLYQTSHAAPGLFDSFLGGLYLIKGVPLFLQLAVLCLYPLAFGLLLLSHSEQEKTKQDFWVSLSKFFSLLALTLSVPLLFTPWDESFINLRHSLNLAQKGNFTFNLSSPSEGTVDFLVFAVIGFLGKLKLPLVELLLFQSWFGGILCALAIEKLACDLEIPNAKKWGFFVATLFPPLMLNSSHGFATSIFAAAILWSIHFTFFNSNLPLSFLLLSLVPLIRWEGFWFLGLCYFWHIKNYLSQKEKTKNLIPLAALGLVPTALLTFYRLKQFDSAIPVPVVYKSSIGNLFYFLLGFRNLFLDLVSTFSLAFLLVWLFAWIFERKQVKKSNRVLPPLVILILFSLPYYFSGGDWFPPAWGRYLFPLTLFLIPITWKLISTFSKQQTKAFVTTLVFSLFICAAAPTSSLIRLYQLMFSHGSALLSLNLKKRTENPTYRPHYLSQLGLHLKQTTQPQDKIGSSELATLMYFSERDAVDFLGLTDLELARKPLRETPTFIRKNPKAAELPLLIFKRLDPGRLVSHTPEYLYLFDLMIEILMDQKNTEEWTNQDYFKALHRWENKFKGLVEPLYGGVRNIIALNYHPFVVTYDNDFCALYFVHESKLAEHQLQLKNFGLEGKLITSESR
jgi:hypothetical protein